MVHPAEFFEEIAAQKSNGSSMFGLVHVHFRRKAKHIDRRLANDRIIFGKKNLCSHVDIGNDIFCTAAVVIFEGGRKVGARSYIQLVKIIQSEKWRKIMGRQIRKMAMDKIYVMHQKTQKIACVNLVFFPHKETCTGKEIDGRAYCNRSRKEFFPFVPEFPRQFQNNIGSKGKSAEHDPRFGS